METSRLSFKLFATNPGNVQDADVVPIFHSWIQTHAISDHLLIDVADYAHVKDGPGILLVSHEANYSFDTRGGKLGLTYQRKRSLSGSLAEGLATSYRATLSAATLLQESLDDRLVFAASPIEFRICDRLAGPNTAGTFAKVGPALSAIFPGATLEHSPDTQQLFTVHITLAAGATLAGESQRISPALA